MEKVVEILDKYVYHFNAFLHSIMLLHAAQCCYAA